MGFGGRGERERREVGQAPAAADLVEDAVVHLLLRGPGAGLLLLGLVEAAGREHRLEALRALARLRRVRLVHDHREAPAGQLADLLGDDRELLQGGDDDGPARLEGLEELARGVVDVLHHPEGLLELPDAALELAVEDAPVGYHHDRVEDAPVAAVVQHRELVGQPRDGEALAAAGRVLHEVALAGAVVARVAHEPAHAVELLVAREYQVTRAGLAPAVVLGLDLVDELADEVEDAVAGPDLLPQVVGRETGPGGRDRRVARAAVAPSVEGQESGLRPREAGGHEHLLGVDREVGEAAGVAEERLAGVAVLAVLADGVADILAVEGVLELGREDGDAVEEEREVKALLVVLAEAELPHDREEVGGVQAPQLFVEAARGAEVREPELAARVLDAVAQDVEGAAAGDLAREAGEEARLDVGAVVLLELAPLLGLGGEEEVDDIGRDQAERTVVVVRAAPVVAARRRLVAERGRRFSHRNHVARARIGAVAQQRALDGGLEGAFGDVRGHGRWRAVVSADL